MTVPNTNSEHAAHEKLEEAHRRIAEARVAIDVVAEQHKRLPPVLNAMLFAVANLLGAVRDGLQRGDLADIALQHLLSGTDALNDATQRGRWHRREFAEDLRVCLTELISATNIVSALLLELLRTAASRHGRRLILHRSC